MAYPDKNVLEVIKQFESRMEVGYKKYGVTTADDKHTDFLGWIQHLQEELMDAIVYIERVKQEIKTAEPENHVPFVID
jgi:hypothetical protein